MSEQVTVVFPVHNEVAVIESVVRELGRSVISKLPSAEALAIDDASTDGTDRALERLAARYRWLRVQHFAVNRGHGAAVSHAITASHGDWVFQLDSDQQFDVDDFWRLWERRNAADLVLGIRLNRQDPAHRLILARIVSLFISMLAGRRIRDPNTPFRLFRRHLWDELEPLLPRSVLVPSILVSLGAAVTSRRIVETPVNHRSRAHAPSTLRRARLVVFCARALAEVTGFRARVALQRARK